MIINKDIKMITPLRNKEPKYRYWLYGRYVQSFDIAVNTEAVAAEAKMFQQKMFLQF